MAGISFVLPLLVLAHFLATASAWGELGHRTVAYLAEIYFDDATADYVGDLLEALDISNASLFADAYRNKHRWTAEWHYINALDDPPRICKVNYRRDCAESCIVKAIVNQTSIVNNADDWKLLDRQQALKFLIHFIGDIHQPLHTELEAKGGNQIDVRFDGKGENLHSVWDRAIPEKAAKRGSDNYLVAAKKWAKKLHEAAETVGVNAAVAAGCDDLGDAQDCAVLWASDSNKFICSYVLKDNVDGVTGVDLGGDYFEGAVPVVEQLITRAGQWLAVWMKALQLQHEVQQQRLRSQNGAWEEL